MPVLEGLLPSKHKDIAQTLIFCLAEWHALEKLIYIANGGHFGSAWSGSSAAQHANPSVLKSDMHHL